MKTRIKDMDANEAEFLRDAGPAFERWVAAHAECPQPDLLRAAQSGALPEEMAEPVNAHARGCAMCSRLQADFEACETPELSSLEVQKLYARIQAAAGKEKARAARAGRGFLWRPAVALAAIALFAFVFWRAGYFTSKPAGLAGHTPAEVAVVPAPIPVTTVFVLEKPEVRVPAAALVWRGRGGSGEQFAKDLGSAFDSYRADDYAAAEKKFSRLSAQHPESVEAAFYLGVCRLFLKQTAGAVEALERAKRVADVSFSADVAWYLSLAYRQAGESAKARALLSQLCKDRSDYATRACAGVQELEKRPSDTPPR